ncbi:hypothetical protein BGZ93_006365 [Podila epicladia]|nr:hypothetical protein BGZ93_006365 [Podila epicladia]
MPSKLFDDFSAWFPSELEKLKYIWVSNGGSVASLATADIAFVTDSTSSGCLVHERRLSLGRYKTVFKALDDFGTFA